MKKSPAEKLMNQITKVQSRLDLLNAKLNEENLKGHNFLPPPQIYLFKEEPNSVVFNYSDEEKEALDKVLKSIPKPKTARGRPTGPTGSKKLKLNSST